MPLSIKSAIGSLLYRAGYSLHRIPKMDSVRGIVPDSGARIHLGTASRRPPGHLQVSECESESADIICHPWELGTVVREAAAISVVHVLEGLETGRVGEVLDVCYDALAVGGVIDVTVTDIDAFIERWNSLVWDGVAHTDAEFRVRSAIESLLNPSGDAGLCLRNVFNAQRVSNLLVIAGFTDIETRSRGDGSVRVLGAKWTRKGERQVAPSLELIRADHRARYEFACRHTPVGARVLDVACGVGYGAWMLATRTEAERVTGIDIDPGAIRYAQSHYLHPRIEYRCGDVGRLELPPASLDVAISFETIEHLAEPMPFLESLAQALKQNGILFCSTPNEEVLPLRTAGNPYHHRHYTPAAFEALMHAAGFEITGRYSQMDRDPGLLIPGWSGLYNLAVCRPRARS